MKPAVDPRPFASLSAGLLARKGEARPAILSHDEMLSTASGLSVPYAVATPVPRRQQAVLAAALTPDHAGRKAAFTLRLDPVLHRRLRLAAASEGRSAQQIVTEALAAFLNTSAPDAPVQR